MFLFSLFLRSLALHCSFPHLVDTISPSTWGQAVGSSFPKGRGAQMGLARLLEVFTNVLVGEFRSDDRQRLP